MMDITNALKRFLMFVQTVCLLVGACLCLPAVRIREPEFEPAPSKLTYKKGEKARLYCSVKHLGERTVVWRKVPDTNPLTIGTTTWVDDPRIFVDHTESDNQWDLIIQEANWRDAGEYECQVSISKKLLRHVVELHVTGIASGQMKRNPEISISGTQFVSRGDNISLFCNVSNVGNPPRTLTWSKGSQEMMDDGDRVTLVYVDQVNREQISSNLKIQPAHLDDSGLYTCRVNDEKLMTSAVVSVLTGGSNNVKRAGSSTTSQESGAVLKFQCALSHSTLLLLMLFIQQTFT